MLYLKKYVCDSNITEEQKLIVEILLDLMQNENKQDLDSGILTVVPASNKRIVYGYEQDGKDKITGSVKNKWALKSHFKLEVNKNLYHTIIKRILIIQN